MTIERTDAYDRQQRFEEVLAACLEAIEDCPQLDRRALAAAHPVFAEELAEFFAQRDGIEQLAGPLDIPAPDGAGQPVADEAPPNSLRHEPDQTKQIVPSEMVPGY